MNTTYNKENLQVHLELIKPAGYTLESFENEFFYTKQEVQRKITITPFYDDYFPHDVVFSSVSVNVLFSNVEQIFHDVYINNSNVYFKHFLNETPTFSEDFSDVLASLDEEKLKSTKVFDDSSFYIVKPLLEQMINAAINFITQNQTLQNFYNLGENMNIDQQANFYIQPLPERKLIIKKLLSISDYNNYATQLINYYTQEGEIQDANFIQSLKTYLDSL